MNRYPQDKSIIVLDNCAIHRVNAIREIVEAQGVLMFFLPPYSPDFNPIEESFGLGEYSFVVSRFVPDFGAVKTWIRRHWRRLQRHEDPEVQLLEAAHSVNGDVARGWFTHSGYNM
jgi:DDE superfamily endonuclease